MKKLLLITFFTISLFAKDSLTVSILPQKFFIEKIAKDKFNINVMVEPGASPATYEPKISQMKELSNSLAYFYIDVPFEKVWLKRFENANKNMLMVDTSVGIKKQEIAKHHHEGEKEDAHDLHEEHEALDPHIWLDPILVKTQAKNIFEALVKIDSANKKFYYENYKNFIFELDILHNKLSEILKPVKGKKFMVFHPSWGYFAKRYDLEQEAVEKEGKEPKPAELVDLINEAKEEGIKVVFVAPQFSQKAAKTIATSINGNVVTMNPLSFDWDNSLIDISNKLVQSYK